MLAKLLIAFSLMAVVVEIITAHISAKYRAEVIARCRSALDAAEMSKVRR